MILAIDVGNTNIVLGCIDGDECLFVERLSTVRTKTELEYAIDIKNVLDIYHIHRSDIEGGIVSSVVPQITNIVKLAVEKILKKEVLVVGAGIKTGLNIRMDNPAQLGSDLVGKMIRWSMKDPAGCIQRGQMSLSQLPGILLSFENSAAETLRRTGSDHVLYAVKIYNAADELTAVQFYMNPMSDEEFHKLAGRGRGTMVYALHNRKVKVAG